MNYQLGNRNIRIPDNEIDRISKGLQVSKQEAIEIWLEDNEYLENEEQAELDKKAKESRITATIHEAHTDKPKAPRKVERKPDEAKESLIKELSTFLADFGAEEVKIINVGKLIEFKLGTDTFKLDLIRQRPPKEKK